MSESGDPGFLALAARLVERTGLDLGAYKERCLRRRIATRMRARGARSYEEYVVVLDREPEELTRLLDALTINVTAFFRNPETWAWLDRAVLPGLLEPRQGRVRAWSAGCASGEEPYTLVILVALTLERLGHPLWLERLQVDATDIDRRSLERATAARYPRAAFAEADPVVLQRFTLAVDDATVELCPEIRAPVAVRRLDLTREVPPRVPYDLILCRNVLIYFDRNTQARLMERFAESLGPGGILVLGKVESLHGPARGQFEVVDPRERIFRKAA